MTPVGFRILVALLLAFVLGGGYLCAPAPTDLGMGAMSCDELLAHPRPGFYRLGSCTVDARDARLRGGDAIVALRSSRWRLADQGPPPLVMLSSEPRHLGVTVRADRDSGSEYPGAYRRFIERHLAALVYEAEVVGRVRASDPGELGDELPDGTLVLDATERFFLGRALGIVLLFFGLLGLLLLVPLQRRWTCSRARLTGTAGPLTF